MSSTLFESNWLVIFDIFPFFFVVASMNRILPNFLYFVFYYCIFETIGPLQLIELLYTASSVRLQSTVKRMFLPALVQEHFGQYFLSLLHGSSSCLIKLLTGHLFLQV